MRIDLRTIPGVEFGSWGQHGPGHDCGYLVEQSTAEKIRAALANGQRVVVGNAPRGVGTFLSRINSRFHGKSIRTIRAL